VELPCLCILAQFWVIIYESNTEDVQISGYMCVNACISKAKEYMQTPEKSINVIGCCTKPEKVHCCCWTEGPVEIVTEPTEQKALIDCCTIWYTNWFMHKEL